MVVRVEDFTMAKFIGALLLVFTMSSGIYGEDLGLVDEFNIYRETIRFVDECGSKELSLCVKERALTYLDAVPDNIDVGMGIKIKQLQDRTSRQQAAPVVLPEEPRAREAALDNALFQKAADFISSHTVEYKVPQDTLEDLKDSVGEGRKKGGGGGGKGGGGMKGMMMLFGLKAAMIGALALKFIALVAFKALLIGKIALTISSIIALKKLFSHHHSSSYEVVAHPTHHESYGHYDRSFELPYNAYAPARGSS